MLVVNERGYIGQQLLRSTFQPLVKSWMPEVSTVRVNNHEIRSTNDGMMGYLCYFILHDFFHFLAMFEYNAYIEISESLLLLSTFSATKTRAWSSHQDGSRSTVQDAFH